jgi:hydroxymethylcytosylglucuronate/cytosylglucuronate synthase
MTIQSKFSLLAATRHIGWGGVGKLHLILEKLPSADIVLHGDDAAVAMTKRFLGKQHTFAASPPPKFDAALVVNDPVAADSAASRGIPVVYVDSLPYMRTGNDVPKFSSVVHYCAQKYPIDLFPITNPLLQSWEDIKWIDPIVPVPQARRGGGGVVISVGGLYVHNLTGMASNLMSASVDSYLELVIPPLVEFLQRSNKTILAICGNINEEWCRRIRALVPGSVAVGPQHSSAFDRLLTEADLLITSPGSTTILQAMSIDLPTLLLPPQNRSQLVNAEIFSKRDATIMRWPRSVLDLDELKKTRANGLAAENNYIYQSIIGAARSTSDAAEIGEEISNGILGAADDGVLDPALHALGIAGADQVAQLVEQVALGQS